MAKPSIASISVALILFISFLAVAQVRPAEAVIGSIEIGTLATPGDFTSAFTSATEATSKDPDRQLVVRVVDADFAAGGAQDSGPSDQIVVTLDSDSSAGCAAASFLMDELAGSGVFVREFFITDEEDKAPLLDGVDGDLVLDNDPDHLFVAEDLTTCGTPGTDVILLAIDGDDVEAEYLESAQTPPGVGLDRYAITMNNDGPVIVSLSPADEFFVSSDLLSLSAQVHPSSRDVVEATVFFILHDEQCTDDEVYWPNGDVRFTVPLLAGDSQFDDVVTLVCAGGAIGIDGLLTPTRDEHDGVVDITEDKFIDLGPNDFAQRFVSVIAVDEAGNISILDVDLGDDARVLAEYTLDTADPDLVEARTGLLFDPVYGELLRNKRNWIMLIFEDRTNLDGNSIDATDFVVEDNTVVEAVWFDEDPIDFDGSGIADDASDEAIRRLVFLRLADALMPGDEPNVFVVPNGVADEAGNVLNSDQVKANDFITGVAGLSIAKIDSPDPVSVGETLNYTLLVTNNATSTATGVEVTDTLPPSADFVSATPGCLYNSGPHTVTCDLNSLGAASSTEVTIAVMPTVAGIITNTSTVTGSEPDPSLQDNTAPEDTQVQGPEVDLSLTKSDSPDPVLVGLNLTYSLAVTNNATSSATSTGITLTDTLATSTAFVSASAGCAYNAGPHTVTCDIGSLGVGAMASSTIVVMPTSAGVITNTAEVTGNEPDPNLANNAATAITTVNPPAPATADLSVTKADSPDPVFVGDTLTYRLIVSNHATSTSTSTATGVTLTDKLPAEVHFVRASEGCTYNSRLHAVTCSLGDLTNTSRTRVVIRVVPTEAGVITNTARLRGNEPDPNLANNTATERTAVRPRPTCAGLPATLIGTDGDDVLIGTPGNDVIVGLAGDDVIAGLGGDDVVCAGPGHDLVTGGDGADTLLGGPGEDVIDAGAGSDNLRGGPGNDILLGRDGNDHISCGSGADFADGGPGTDAAAGDCEFTVNVP